MTTPFPLGVYVGGPNGSDPTAEARFETAYNAFTADLNAPAQFMDSFIDQTKPVSQWASNSSWIAWSQSKSAVAKNLTPIIALPMTSTAYGNSNPDAYYKSFASGAYDSVLQGIVKTWADNGFKDQVYRPGWEMNLPDMPSYAGNDAATQADWVSAFQHIYTTLHAAGAADGVNITVAWNPSTINYAPNVQATTMVYPGDAYVDVVAADVYGDVFPYGNPIYDWSKSGQVLHSAHPVFSTLQQWASDPINLMHYYSYPASTQWSLDGSGGHSLSLQNLIDFAKAHGKSFAVAETGAGGTSDHAGVVDNPAFVQWLATTLQDSGVTTKFVNIWDFNNGNDDQFTNATDKPLEAAAWAKYFGSQSTYPTTVTLGSGADTLDLKVSETAYDGDAQFTVSVDGVQVGGTQTAQADHGAGEDQDFVVNGDWGSGTHAVAIDFLNDAWGGSASADRNLYVDGTTYNGVSVDGGTLALGRSGTQILTVGTPSNPTVVIGTGADTIDMVMSEDAYNGDAQFTVSVDGVQVGGTQTATASHAAGEEQHFQVKGDFGAGQHTVSVKFLNDAYAGAGLDRNLYVDGANFDGVASASATLALKSAGTQSFQAGLPDTLSLQVAEDAYQGDAQFTVAVDGVQLGGTRTATASHALGQTQQIDIGGNWGAGTHTVAVTFLNDAWGGSSGLDRNLYVTGGSYDGTTLSGLDLLLNRTGTQTFTFSDSGKVTTDSFAPDDPSSNATISASAGTSAMSFVPGAEASTASSSFFESRALLDALHAQAAGALDASNFGVAAALPSQDVYGAGLDGATIGGTTDLISSDNSAWLSMITSALSRTS